MDDINNILGEDKKKEEKEEEIYTLDKFRSLPRPDLYSPFDNIFDILKKKILIESKEDIFVWEDSITNKFGKSIKNLDSFFQHIVKIKEQIKHELLISYYQGKLKLLDVTEVDFYMRSELWDQEELLKNPKERFNYEYFIDKNKYTVYQAVNKKDNSKFHIIIMDCFAIRKMVIKSNVNTNYYLLDLTEEYKEFYNF